MTQPVAHAFKVHDGWVLFRTADAAARDYIGWFARKADPLPGYQIIWPEDRVADEEAAAALRSTE